MHAEPHADPGTTTPGNHLLGELSPYLLQHAHNPVDWYPWGDEALRKARDEDKPILLSIGYSACHWCHVMAHESFENEDIAAIMNERFVSIKVDREERPDLDHVYQTVCQLLTRSGGWPLTVFLTPDQQPFYAGTYFPPEERFGRPGFRQVLLALAEAYHEQREQVAEQAGRIIAALQQVQSASPGEGEQGDLLQNAYDLLAANFDHANGGFGGAPKFPNPFGLELFLRRFARDGTREALDMVVRSCRKMRAGGIYDQLGGGFHRYSVDTHWAVPHFEKMLYDNALLPPIYLAAYQATGDEELAATARETLDYLLREMRSPEGGLYSTTDADSEGEEGRYFVWTPAQIRGVLEPREAALAMERFGVTAQGNFDHGATVLSAAKSLESLAEALDLSPDEAEQRLTQVRAKLLEARAQRVPPFRDEKILAGWNGLALTAFARAGLVLDEPRYLTAARDIATFLTTRLARDEGHLYRLYKDGTAKGEGYLEDYADVIGGLLELFCASGEPGWYHHAVALTETVLSDFADEEQGDFYMTDGGETLVVRPKENLDNATPSGLSVMVHNLLRLDELSGDERYGAAAERALAAHAGGMHDNPWGMAYLIAAWDTRRTAPRSVVVSGDGAPADALVRAAAAHFAPDLLICRRPAAAVEAELPSLLRNRAPEKGRAAAYVCREMACLAPVSTPGELQEELAP